MAHKPTNADKVAMAAARHTPFPDLNSVVISADTPRKRGSFKCPTPSDPAVLAEAWAHLLRCYTGEDRPVFRVNGASIRFDLAAAERISIEVAEAHPAQNMSTEVITNDRVSHDPNVTLYVRCSSIRSECVLHSSGFVPQTHLGQIGHQLAEIMRWLSAGSEGTIPWDESQHVQLAILNRNPHFQKGPQLLHHLVSQGPDKSNEAVRFLRANGSESTWSYDDLHRHSDAFALKLRSALQAGRPSQAQSIVPILLSQSPELYMAILGILKAGAAFCPLDLDVPDDRLRFIVGDVGATVVVTDEANRAKFDWKGGPTALVAEEAPPRDGSESSTTPKISVEPDPTDLAYVMYTSGSTGTPKGVCISHSAATQSLLAHRHIPDFDTFLQFAAPAFDVFVFEMFFPLFRGRTLCGCHRNGLLGDLPGIIRRMHIDAAELTPTVAGGLLKRREDVPSLRLLLTIGEMLTHPIVEEFGGEIADGILCGMYGPTEAAIHCTHVRDFEKRMKPSLIGEPLDTVSAWIIAPATDDTDQEEEAVRVLPIGHIGELAVGGHQLAQGYLNNVRQTTQAFIDDPDYGRLYRTGDKARLLPGGQLEILGRMKSGQVKLRGQRVELGEVEEAALKTPGVQGVSTSVIDGILIAFCLTEDSRLSEAGVLRVCRQWLPSFMVPGDIVLLKTFPRLISGKVDKRALELLYANKRATVASEDDPTAASPSETSWDTTELEIRDVLSSLSGIPSAQILPSSTIYQLGIDSLAAVHVANELRRKGDAVFVGDVLEFPSIKQLASYIRSARRKSTAPLQSFDFASFDCQHRPSVISRNNLIDSDVAAIRPCTPVQAGMIARFLHSSGSMYFNHFIMQLDPTTNLEKLKKSWLVAQGKFDMLRTGFVEVEDKHTPFAMVTYKDGKASLPWDDRNDRQSSIRARERITVEVLNALHFMPWRLSVLREDSKISIQLSALHALYDAYSLQIILSAVVDAYHGRPSSPPTSIEPVLSSILNSSSNKPERADQFWSDQPDNFHPARFPNLTPSRVTSTGTPSIKRQCSWSRTRLEDKCKERGSSLQAAGQTAWARILSAYTGEASVTFGLVLSGRLTEDGAERVAFPCITTLPTCCTVSGSSQDLVQRTLENTRKLLKHQFTPLSKIQRLIGNPREALFDSIFAFQKLEDASARPERLWSIVEEAATADCVISIELEPTIDDEFIFHVTFREDVVPASQAQIILDQLNACLIDTISRPEAACHDLSHIHSSLLSITPAKEPTLPSDVRFLHQFVERQARAIPGEIALEWVSSIRGHEAVRQQWTYSQLNDKGNQVAHLLRENGANTGDLIAICFDKCPEASFAILGILKAGCAFVALDPNAPIRRKTFVAQDSDAAIILTMEKLGGDLSGRSGVKVICMDEPGSIKALERMPRHPIDPGSTLTPGATCYCLYTSGTTGTPKGCEITHENVVQAMLAFQRLFAGRWDSNSRWLQFASFHFDVSVLEQYWSWSVGICVTSAPRDLIFEDIARTIRTLGITHIDLTPSLAKLVHPDEVPSLHSGVFITGGERLSEEVIEAWGPVRCIFNSYGPTEATIGVTTNPRVSSDSKPSNIGPQFDNVGTYVFQQGTTQPVLRGTPGELCVSGKLVGKGYLNRSDLTKERFPYLEGYDERVYRTGDLVRILHDGSFEYLGRVDDQIKLRGQRMEVDEINAVIKREVKDVDEVVTLLLRHPSQQRDQLSAFFVTRSQTRRPRPAQMAIDGGGTSLIDNIREACRRNLPTYMLPTHIIPLNAIPLSANNKADARQIKEFFNTLSVEEMKSIASTNRSRETVRSKDEIKIIEILAQMTGVQNNEISKDSSILELGLDSITVIGFARMLREAGFEKALTSVIMGNSTVGSLAKVLGSTEPPNTQYQESRLAARQRIAAFAHQHASTISRSLGQEGVIIDVIAPCTPLQEGMLSRSISSGEPLYLSVFYYRIPQHVNLESLSRAWRDAIGRYQILRTHFVATSDGFAQVALKAKSPCYGLDTDSPIQRAREPTEIGQQPKEVCDWYEANRDNVRQPFRVVLGRDAKGPYLALCHHHALFDYWSHRLMIDRVAELYMGRSGRDGPDFFSVLPDGPLCELDGSRNFWTKRLKHSEYHGLPIRDSPKLEPDTVSLRVPGGQLESLRRRLKTTNQALLQACWVNVLRKYIGSSVNLGIVVSGRGIDVKDIENTIGPLFNTIPFHIRCHSGSTWANVVQECQEYNTAALPYQHTALRNIMKSCGRSTDRPLFDVLFSYQQEAEGSEASKVFVFEREGPSLADYPLALEALHRSDGDLNLTIVAQDLAIDGFSPQQVLVEVKMALETLMRDPNAACFGTEDTGDTEKVQSPARREEMKRDSDLMSASFDWTPTASQLRDEIAKLAREDTEKISERATILELGLDSIDAIKLSSRMTRRGVDLSVSTIMRHLTIAGIVPHLGHSTNVKAETTTPDSAVQYEAKLRDYLVAQHHDLSDVEDVLPATPLQESMVAEMRNTDYQRYFNHDILKLEPEVEELKFQAAWSDVVRATPILRTSFAEIDDPGLPTTYAMLVHRPGPPSWHVNIAPHGTELQPLLDRLMRQSSDELIHDPHKPPVVLNLVRHEQGDVLLLSIAHALYDGYSIGLLHNDVRKAYHGRLSPRPSIRPILDNIRSSSGLDAEAFWKSSLLGASPSTFPCQGIDSPGVTRAERTSSLSAESLQTFCKSQGITLHTLGQTCWTLYLNRLDVIFGVVMSGRDTEEAYKVAFPLMNTVAVRTILHGSRRDMLRYMQENNANILQYQHFPLRKAQAFAKTGGKRLFDTLFIYQKRPEAGDGETKPLYHSVDGVSDVEYRVCVEMEVVDDRLIWRAAVRKSVLGDSGGSIILDAVDSVLCDIVREPDAPTVTSRAYQRVIDETERSEVTGAKSERTGRWTDSEKTIRSVLAEVSGTSEADITRDLTIFHLGLDSISAIKVSSLLRKQSIKLSVSEIMEAATIDGMVTIIERPRKAKPSILDTEGLLSQAMKDVDSAEIIKASGIDPSNVERVMPASAGQVFLLLMWQRSWGTIFNSTFTYQANRSMDPTKLDQAWHRLKRHLIILRTTFATNKDDMLPLVQVVLKENHRPVVWFTDDEPEEKFAVDFKTPPVVLFAQQNARGTLLKLRIHHALYDAVSLPAIVRSLEQLYSQPDRPLNNNADMSDIVAYTLSPDSRAKRQQFWTQYLRDAHIVLSALQPRLPSESVTRTEVFDPYACRSLDVTKLQDLARQSGSTIQALFLAAFAKVHASLTTPSPRTSATSRSVVFGLYLANRSDELSRFSLAPAVNVVPLRVRRPSRPLVETAKDIQRDLQQIGTVQNSCVSLLEIKRWTGVEIDVAVNFLRLPGAEERDPHPHGTEGEEETDQGIVIKHVRDEKWKDRRREVVEYPAAKEFITPLEGVDEEVFRPTIDIEATINEQGGLEMGVFAPTEMCDVERAVKIIKGVSALLREP